MLNHLLQYSSKNSISKFQLSWIILPASGKHNCDCTFILFINFSELMQIITHALFSAEKLIWVC